MQEIAFFINERKRETDNNNKIIEIQNRCFGKVPSLVDPKRRFIREGSVTILDDKGPPKEKIFFLFNDKLLITKPNLILSKITKDNLRVEDFVDVTKWKAILDSTLSTVFSFLDEHENIVMKVILSSKEERDSWVNDFNKVREEILNSMNRSYDLAKQRSQTKAEELKKSFSHQYIQKDKSVTRLRGKTSVTQGINNMENKNEVEKESKDNLLKGEINKEESYDNEQKKEVDISEKNEIIKEKSNSQETAKLIKERSYSQETNKLTKERPHSEDKNLMHSFGRRITFTNLKSEKKIEKKEEKKEERKPSIKNFFLDRKKSQTMLSHEKSSTLSLDKKTMQGMLVEMQSKKQFSST